MLSVGNVLTVYPIVYASPSCFYFQQSAKSNVAELDHINIECSFLFKTNPAGIHDIRVGTIWAAKYGTFVEQEYYRCLLISVDWIK